MGQPSIDSAQTFNAERDSVAIATIALFLQYLRSAGYTSVSRTVFRRALDRFPKDNEESNLNASYDVDFR